MLLASLKAMELLKPYFVVFLWIVIPVLLISMLVITLLHRYKKRKKIILEEDDSDILAFPESINFRKGEEEYIYFDHSELIAEFKQRLSESHTRNIILQHDFSSLQEKYEQAVSPSGAAHSFTHNKENMEKPNEQMIRSAEEEKNLQEARLEQLTREYRHLELENESLREKLQSREIPLEEKDALLIRLQDEILQLKKNLAEQNWMTEVLEEKRAEIRFLQNQLEQRIRNQHQSELQKAELENELGELKTVYQHLGSERDMLRDHLKREREEQLALKQEIHSRDDQVTLMGNHLKEIKDQNELFQAAVADRQDEIQALQEKLGQADSRLFQAEQKFDNHRKLIKRFYTEFSRFMNEEEHLSPVVTMETGQYAEQNP